MQFCCNWWNSITMQSNKWWCTNKESGPVGVKRLKHRHCDGTFEHVSPQVPVIALYVRLKCLSVFYIYTDTRPAGMAGLCFTTAHQPLACILLMPTVTVCHMGTAIVHPVPDWVKPSFVIFNIRALWRSWLSVRVPACQKLQMMA